MTDERTFIDDDDTHYNEEYLADEQYDGFDEHSIRAEREDDDGYDPYSDRVQAEPLFEPDPWK